VYIMGITQVTQAPNASMFMNQTKLLHQSQPFEIGICWS